MKLSKFLKKANLIKILKKIGIKNLNILDNDIMGSCPLHEDNNPSWGVNKITGQYNCFSCGDRGNLITLIAKQMDISSSEAVKVLYQFAGISMKMDELVIGSKMVYRQIKKMLKPKVCKQKEKKVDAIISLPLNVTYNFIHGVEYFKNRGINEATLRRYGITFCTSGFYKNRAIIPILDYNGKLVNFEARDITGIAEKKVLYPKGVNINNTLYNLQYARDINSVIIVEGLMDVLYLSQMGFNVVSTYGVNISERQEQLLNKYFSRVYMAYDGDKAGRVGMIKYGSRLDLHLSVYIIILPKGKDPDGLTKKKFTELYKQAESLDSYLTKRLVKKLTP